MNTHKKRGKFCFASELGIVEHQLQISVHDNKNKGGITLHGSQYIKSHTNLITFKPYFENSQDKH